MLNKIQFLFLICALPVLLLPFGRDGARQRGFWHGPRRHGQRWPQPPPSRWSPFISPRTSVVAGFDDGNHAELSICRRCRLGANVYWPAIAVWIGLGMAVYAVVWRSRRLGSCWRDVRRGRRLHDRTAGALRALPPQRRRCRLPPAGADVQVRGRFRPAARRQARCSVHTTSNILFAGRRRRDRAANICAGILAAADDLPRMVRHCGDGDRHPPARVAPRAAGRGPHADGLGHRHAGHGARTEAGIFPAHRSVRHHRRRLADRRSSPTCNGTAGPTRSAPRSSSRISW